MNTIKYALAKCPHCQGDIEIPLNLVRQPTPCPLCGVEMVLKEPKRSNWLLALSGAVLIGVFAWAGILAHFKKVEISHAYDDLVPGAKPDNFIRLQIESSERRNASLKEELQNEAKEEDLRQFRENQLAEMREANRIAEQAQLDASFDRFMEQWDADSRESQRRFDNFSRTMALEDIAHEVRGIRQDQRLRH